MSIAIKISYFHMMLNRELGIMELRDTLFLSLMLLKNVGLKMLGGRKVRKFFAPHFSTDSF